MCHDIKGLSQPGCIQPWQRRAREGARDARRAAKTLGRSEVAHERAHWCKYVMMEKAATAVGQGNMLAWLKRLPHLPVSVTHGD